MPNELDLLEATRRFRNEAVKLFSPYSGSPEKALVLHDTIKKIRASAPQREMVLQAARAIQSDVFRGSVVLCWAATIDAVQCYVFDDKYRVSEFFTCNERRRCSLDVYRERFGERDFLDVARKAKLLSKSQHQELVAMLNERNACAHPSDRWPTINEATGYADKAVRYINEFSISEI